MPYDRRYRTRREADRDFLWLYHNTRFREARETAIVAGGLLLSALAILIFG